MREIYGRFRAEDRRFALVVSRTNELITRQLLAGALDCLRQHGGSDEQIDVFWVALGALIRGATPHFDYLASAASSRLANLATHSDTYVSFGLLTTDTMEQALERAGSKAGNHGWKAVLAAIEMADLLDQLDGE
jgi:6,7-dimethyl-8-ribityllumazine synthase